MSAKTGSNKSTRKTEKSYKPPRSLEGKCSSRSNRPKRACCRWMISNYKLPLDWPCFRILSWRLSWSISHNKQSNYLPRTRRWNLTSREWLETSAFTKTSKKNWLNGRISARRSSSDSKQKIRNSLRSLKLICCLPKLQRSGAAMAL